MKPLNLSIGGGASSEEDESPSVPVLQDEGISSSHVRRGAIHGGSRGAPVTSTHWMGLNATPFVTPGS